MHYFHMYLYLTSLINFYVIKYLFYLEDGTRSVEFSQPVEFCEKIVRNKIQSV